MHFSDSAVRKSLMASDSPAKGKKPPPRTQKDTGKYNYCFKNQYQSNYHILACGSTLNYFTVIIRLLMQCRIGQYTNLVYTLSNLM